MRDGRNQAGKQERVVFTSRDLDYCLRPLDWKLNKEGHEELSERIQRWLDAKVNV